MSEQQSRSESQASGGEAAAAANRSAASENSPQALADSLSNSSREVSPSSSSSSSAQQKEKEQKEQQGERLNTLKSQVSFSGVVLSRPISQGSSQYLELRTRSSFGLLLPPMFFQSQADIRTWGVEDITDPSIQPYDKDSPSLPHPFHVTLPGYAPGLCVHAISKGPKQQRDPFFGPEINVFPPTWIPQWTPSPNFVAQRYGYNWKDSEAYKMDRLPYVNAEFDPVSAEASNLYNQCYPYTAYPYGVPRVA